MQKLDNPAHLSKAPAQSWPDAGLEHMGACPVCKSTTRVVLYAGLTDRVFHCASGVWTLYSCLSCGSAYLDPRPTLDTIGQAYQKYYTHVTPLPYGEALSIPFARLRLALRNGYVNRRFGYVFQPALPVGYYLAHLFPSRKYLEDRWLRHLPLPRQDPLLLDVGCGNGSFLLQMKELGWAVEGSETDLESVQIARKAGLKVQQGSLSDIVLPENHYAAITMSHVLEHVHDPLDNLQACFRALRPGGILWIAIPNLMAFGHRVFQEHWLGLDAPRHLVLFTPKSLQNLLRQAGFEVLYRPFANWDAQWIFQASFAISQGFDPINDPPKLPANLRRKAHLAHFYSWINPELSEDIILLARKPAG